jgi:hypothetical protein
MSRSWYDVAQICLNGHVINESVQEHPENNKDYCEKCGNKTITECPKCGAKIIGAKYFERNLGIGRNLSSCYLKKRKGYSQRQKAPSVYEVSSYCPNCGNPYPWTERKIKAAHELTQELDSLNDKEKKLLEKSIDDIIKGTPETKLAVTKIKKLLPKIGKEAGNMLRDLIVDIASESVKKMLWR